ncbi:MAG: translation elongation factor Ts [Chloroflexi bacterium]|nr:translation elongation factor Ts [Chloroflexota bacterium]
MQISTADIKALREATGAGVMDCKRALTEAEGDVEKAKELLRQTGLAFAEKKAHRVASQGLIGAYLHAGGRIGAMVEVNCETDFVARTPEFQTLAHDLAMQVAATNPLCLDDEDMSTSGVNPEEVCLLRQPFIKDPGKTVRDVVSETMAKVGENVRVKRFVRFEVGKLNEQGDLQSYPSQN